MPQPFCDLAKQWLDGMPELLIIDMVRVYAFMNYMNYMLMSGRTIIPIASYERREMVERVELRLQEYIEL